MSENGSDAVQPTEPKTITVEKLEMAERKIAKPKKKQNTKTNTTENKEPETKTDETKETTTRDDYYTAGTSFSANYNTVNTSGAILSVVHDNIVNTASNTNQTDSNNEKHILRVILPKLYIDYNNYYCRYRIYLFLHIIIAMSIGTLVT